MPLQGREIAKGRDAMRKEIIVYLDDYKYSGDGNYDTMYLDFRTADDFRHYWQALWPKTPTPDAPQSPVSLAPTKSQRKAEPAAMPAGSYLQIDGYRSPRRLIRGAYYALNVAMLKQLAPKPVPESLTFAHSFDFGNYSGQNDDAFHLLQKHELLNPEELESSHHNAIQQLDDVFALEYLQFRVHDVSQANWNEILCDQHVLFVYDMGAPLHAKTGEVQRYIDSYASSYTQDKPVLILSHWDIDHSHCLLKMSEDEIRNSFSRFICPDRMKTCTSQRIFNKMVSALGKANVHCLSLPKRTEGSSYPQEHLKFCNQGLRLYIGERCINTNYSGIILYVVGTRGNVILSGDSLLVQASDVLADATAALNEKREHHLVVPHHGGDFKGKKIYRTYNIPEPLTPIHAIISVDESNNTYGHPSGDMIDYLTSIAGWTILRTDQGNGTQPFDLSWNIIEEKFREHNQRLNEYFGNELLRELQNK